MMNSPLPYITLSEQIRKLHNPQRSDLFVKQLRTAVREGHVVAADLPSRFVLPKQYVRRGSTEMYTRNANDMIIDATPAFEAWFGTVNRDLSRARSGKIKVSAEAIEAGLVDFKALAAQTRTKMGASFQRGQALGQGRAAPEHTTPKTASKKAPTRRR